MLQDIYAEAIYQACEATCGQIHGIKGHYATALYSAASKQNELE